MHKARCMPIQFTIEQRHLTDPDGKPAPANDASFHVCDADTADEAVRSFVKADGAEVLGTIMKFPGFQAVATVRTTNGVYTLQVSPSSQSRMPV